MAAPRSRVWEVLADIGRIDAWNPGVRESHRIADHSSDADADANADVGVGAQRFCDLGNSNYLYEQVLEYVPQERLVMRIDRTNLPFADAQITFDLTDDAAGTLVTVSPHYRLRYRVAGSALDWTVVRHTYRRGMRSLLTGLRVYVESDRS